MSFQQGLSGLNAASKNLDTIGNNVANASTVGYKAGRTIFADVYANSLNGSGASNIGIGVKVAEVTQQFTTGNITPTSNPLDVAINGGGFFRMSDGGTITYGRNGQFTLSKEGYIINSNKSRLTGYVADLNGVLQTGTPTEINIQTSDISPKQTTTINEVLNLDSRKNPPTTTPFSTTDPTSYNNATAVTVYDSLGNSHVVQSFYVKTAANTWDVYATVDGTVTNAVTAASAANAAGTIVGTAPTNFGAVPANTFTFTIGGTSYNIGAIAAGTSAVTQGQNVALAINNASIPGVTATVDAAGVVTIANTGPLTISTNGTASTAAAAAELLSRTGFTAAQFGTQAAATSPVSTLAFNTSGALVSGSPLTVPVAVATGATTPFNVSIDYKGTTQHGSAYGETTLTQDGYTSGRLSGFSIGADGMISGRYTNGQSRTLGQIVLANFTNPNGLQPLGNNTWAETSESGQAMVGTPDTGSRGVLQQNAVEDSNVDLTQELVNMITAQRYYQANAQTIKTQDQVMQTLVNLR